MTTSATTTERQLATVPGTPPHMTWDEFLAWSDEDIRAEWIDGKVITMSPPSIMHQFVASLLDDMFGVYLRERPVGVRLQEVLMRFEQHPSGRQPDLLVLLNEHRDRIKQTHLDGPADLVVEIVSQESQARDRGEKFVEYQAAGIPEYWLIDPLLEAADFYRLGDDGRYHRVALDDEGRFESAVLPDLFVDPGWLWQVPDLDVKTILDELRARLA